MIATSAVKNRNEMPVQASELKNDMNFSLISLNLL